MSGKFSQPRPHRDEERQIEEAFRQVTEPSDRRPRFDPGKIEYTPKPKEQPTQPLPKIQEEPVNFPFPEPEPEKGAPIPEPPAPEKPKPIFDDFFREDLMEEDFQEDFQESEPDLVDKLMNRWEILVEQAGKNRKVVLITLCALAMVMVCGFVGVLVGSFSDPYDRKILDNVTILDVQVGGMTKMEATAAVKQVADNLYAQNMVIDLSGNQITLTPRDTRVSFDTKAAVEAAYNFGRVGTNAEKEQAYLLSKSQIIPIEITASILEVDEGYIQTVLSAYAQEAGATLTQTAYGLEGFQPELSAEKYNVAAPGQTLVITMGTPGIGFDVNDVTKQVVKSYQARQFLVTVENVEVTRDPDPIDLRAIWEELHIEPVEASVDPQTNKATSGSYGYTFDLEAAQVLVDAAQFGEVIRIPMEYVEPEILEATAFFRDILGEHQTRHTGDSARNNNLTLACQVINGTVLEPGESFSFNSATGQRTSAQGYKNAPDDTTEYTTEFVGGGVSQVSSTLYYAAVLASMEMQQVYPGKYAPGFIVSGMDAQVSNSRDLGFRNPHSYPVRIEAQVKGGYVTVRIVGTETRDYYIMVEQSLDQTIRPETVFEDFSEINPDGWQDGDVVQEGITGYVVKTYCVFYDRQTNAQTKRNFLSTTSYQSEDRIVAKVEIPETTEATVPPTTQAPTVPPTVPPTTQPPIVTEPATEPPIVTQPETEPSAVATQPTEISETVPAEGALSQQETGVSEAA